MLPLINKPTTAPTVKPQIVFCGLAAALVLLPACKPKAPPPVLPPPTVQVVEVTQADVPIVREWVGTLDGSDNAAIQAQVTGYLLAQAYRDGESVQKDQLLFKLDDRNFKAAQDQARAALAQAQARLTKADNDVARYTPLAASDAISKQELDDAIQAQAAAKASVEAARAALDEAGINLGFTQIKSPISGIAGISNAQVGELITATRGNLTTVSTIDPIKAIFTMSEQEYLAYRMAFDGTRHSAEMVRKLPFELVLANGAVYPEKGHLLAIDRQVDERTGAIKLEVSFPNPKGLLRPGQFSRVRATVSQEKGALLVPQRAVTELQGGYLVAKVGTDNKVAIVPVRVGERYGSQWIVKSGLKAGDKIVAEGTQKARDGVVVHPVPFQEKSAPKNSAEKH